MFQQTLTITGDGVASQFSFPHGLSSTPTPYSAFGDANTRAISACYGNYDLTADSTNVTFDFGNNIPALGVVMTFNVYAL